MKLTLAEIAKEYKRTPRTFRKYVLDLGVPYILLGKSMMFDPAKVEAFLESLTPRREKMELPGKKSPKPQGSTKSEFTGVLGPW